MKDKKTKKVEIKPIKKIIFDTAAMSSRYESQKEDLQDIYRRRQVGQETLALMVNLS